MRKRSKLLVTLLAGALTLGAIGVAFSAWSTDIGLNGAVSANGKWDVEVVSADVGLSSAGAALGTSPATIDVDTWQLVAKKSGSSYIVQLDDVTGSSVKALTEAELAAVSGDQYAIYSNYSGNSQFTSGNQKGGAHGNYYLYLNSLVSADNLKFKFVGAPTITSSDDIDGQVIGYAVKSIAKINGQKQVAAMDPVTSTTEIINDNTTVNYADVAFSLPDAWANYSVTVENKGTANANLSAYNFDFTALDENIYETDVPDGFDNEVLAPGERCTFNFVVKVRDTGDDLTAESAAFSVSLHYAQDAVDAAPAAGHVNG